jgi:hypothetical protein
MEKGKIQLTQKDAENTPAGGVVVGKRDGQTMIYDDASLGGYFVGKLHKDGGIKMVNKSTGQPLEVQGAEVIITAPAVNDQTKREFEGKMMTNREILSKINSDGGGVSFAEGGDIPAKIHTTDCEYKFGGKVVKDTNIANSLGMNSTLKKGKQHFTSGDTTYDVDGIYNAIKKGKLRLKTKEVETFPMKYSVYDKNYAENHKIDFRKPNGITVRTESGEEVLIDGNHRMNNAYLNGRKTMKTYYIEDPKQIAKFTKKNKFELGGENKIGGHLSSGKSLKKIAQMHNVSLAHINEELAKGLEVEKEHFADFKERTRVAKDHLVENPNYYTILAKAGLKMGGHIQRQELVEKSKKGDTPARDLNNYNDVMDLGADEAVGGDSGLAFAKGGVVYDTTKPKIEKVTIKETKYNRASVIGRNATNVSEFQQIVSDYIGNTPKEDVDWINFYVNDSTRGSYYIDLNKGKKNTVKNVNPETLNSLNFKRVIDAKTYLVKNYDWTDFFEMSSANKASGQVTTSTKTPLTKEELFNSRIWIGDNVELRDKVIAKLTEIGIPFDKINGNANADESISINIYDYDFVVYKEPKEEFNRDTRRKEIFPEDLGIDATTMGVAPIIPNTSTSAQPFDFAMTKIDVMDNVDLSARIQQKAFEDGWEWENGGGKNTKNFPFNYMYFTKTSISYGNTTSSFDNSPKREITEAEIFGSQMPVATTVKIPVVYQIKIYTTDKNTGDRKVSVARSFEDFFRIIKKLVVTKDEFADTIQLSIFTDDTSIKYLDLSFAVEEQAFDLLTDIEAKENLMDKLSANNQGIDFKEFFSKSQDKNVDYVILKEEIDFPDGQNIYTGSNILKLLQGIYKNSPIENIKVEIDLVVNGQAEDAPLTLTLTGVPTYPDYEINPNDINEQILYSKFKIDWFPEYQFDKLFPLIDELDFYLSESYLSNFKTKNINELYSKLNTPEVKNSDKEITLIWFGEDGETHKFGAYFTDNATVYYQIDRDNFTLDLLRGKLDDWFYGRLSENYMFPDGQVKAKTPTSNSAVPKTVENTVYNLDLAIQKLEKASSSVVTEYNKEIYDQSLKFLYDTKATYELALKFTPESAFMYERLDIMKKLANIEKQIKNIEDMKKGGTFYMLAKILEKLERGENWRQSETAQDVITNAIPQSEIDIIIRSQKFKNWFGDWEKALINDEYDNVSKALTNGIPTVYHHGARRIKYTYREVSNGVLYLAENVSYAIWFSQNAIAQSEEGNYLTECFVNIKNPIDLTAFRVNQVDLGDIVRYVDAVYPMAKIYDYIPAQVALLIKTNQPTNVRMWAWQLIRSYAKFVNHIKENTPYDGFLYYENNPSDQVVNPATGQSEENVTKAVAIFKSHQVKVVDAVLFDGGLDDWRFENGGKIKN